MTKLQRLIIGQMLKGYVLVAFSRPGKTRDIQMWTLQKHEDGKYEDGFPVGTITCHRLIEQGLIQRQSGLDNIFRLKYENDVYERRYGKF